MMFTRRGEGVRLRWTSLNARGWEAVHKKLEPTDVILSPYAKKLALFGPDFHIWTE